MWTCLIGSACGRLRYDRSPFDAASDASFDAASDTSFDASFDAFSPVLVGHLGGSGAVEVFDMVGGPSGETYVVGTFAGELAVGGITTTTADREGCFFARFEADGSVAWLADVISRYSVCESIDLDGDRVAVGVYTDVSSTLTIHHVDGSVMRPALASGSQQISHAIVLTLRGAPVEVIDLDASGNDQLRHVDLSGNRILLSGSYAAAATGFGGVLLPSGMPMPSTFDQGFVLSRVFPTPTSGPVGWAQPIGGDSDTMVFAVAGDATGACASGRYVTELDIGRDLIIEGTQPRRAFIASFGATGALVASFDGEPVNAFRELTRSASECIAIGSDTTASAVVIRMNSATGATTRSEIGESTLWVATDFVLSATGDALIPGGYGPGTWTLPSGSTVFETHAALVATLAPAGALRIRRVPVVGESDARAIAYARDGSLIVATSFPGVLEVGGMRLVAGGTNDTVLVRMAP